MATQQATRIRQAIRKQCLLEAAEDGHATVAELAAEADIPKRSARKLANELLDDDRLEEVDATAAPENAPIYALASEVSDR